MTRTDGMVGKFLQINRCKQSLFVAALSVLLCAITSAAGLASEQEQFSLKQQPALLFDGGSDTLTGVSNGIPYEIVQGYAIAQGDMVLGRLFADGRLEIPVQQRGLGQAGTFERWPDGIIPYQFSAEVTQIQRDRAQEAIAHWNDRATIKLVSRNSDNADQYNDYLSFEASNGCASWVGRTGGEQAIWLSDTCTVGSIIHEIGHAIGLFHEHTRPDRDSFVVVNWDNVTSGKELNFEKIEVGANNYSDYDYGSIMHYGEYFFSRNGNPSITVPDGVSIGQREALSALDVASVNRMYATDLKLDISTSSSGDNLQIDFLVSNIGELGANTLTLNTTIGDDADWLSISRDSGWNCQQFGVELRCTRDTLAERTDSAFSVLVQPNSGTVNDLKVRVESRTLDLELANNVFNDEIVAEEPGTDSSNPPSSGTDSGSEPTGDSPANPSTGDGNSDSGNNEQTNNPVDNNTSNPETDNPPSTGGNTSEPALGQANAGSNGGGSASGFTLLALLLFTLRFYQRCRRSRTRRC